MSRSIPCALGAAIAAVAASTAFSQQPAAPATPAAPGAPVASSPAEPPAPATDPGPRRGEAPRWRADGPMSPEMVERVLAVARDVSPELAAQLEKVRSAAPEEMSQAMRQNARRLVALAILKDRNPALYAIRVEDVRLQLELRKLGEDFRAATEAGDKAKAAGLDAQIAAKVRTQVDVDLRARAQELVALDEQVKSMRDELAREQRETEARVAERIEAVRKGQPIQERGMFGDGGPGGRGRSREPGADGDRPRGQPAPKPRADA